MKRFQLLVKSGCTEIALAALVDVTDDRSPRPMSEFDLKKLRKAIDEIRTRKIVGEGPAMAWDFENQCFIDLPPKNW